jgi:L-iditol 2-dehydrogenase
VSVQPNTYCGMCRYCRAGREHLCSRLRAYGVHLDGGFSEAMVAHASALYRLSDGTDPLIGCLTEPLACCIHGIDRARLHSGSSVLVIGAGLIGLMLTRLLRLAGAGLIVVGEPQQARRSQAIEFGADGTVDSTTAEGEAAAMEDSNAGGFDLVIDAVGSRGSFEQAVRMTARGGSILVFGVATPSTLGSVSPFEIYARELTILGSFINPYTHERAVDLLPQMHLEKLRTNRFPLASYREAFEAQASSADSAKVVILPQE